MGIVDFENARCVAIVSQQTRWHESLQVVWRIESHSVGVPSES